MKIKKEKEIDLLSIVITFIRGGCGEYLNAKYINKQLGYELLNEKLLTKHKKS